MQSQNKFFDDLSKVLNGLAGTVAGVGREAEASARERAKEWFGGMDFVSREEFDAVKEMAATARTEAEALKKRVDALEKAVAKAPAAARPSAKPTAVRQTSTARDTKPATRKTAMPSKTAAKPQSNKSE